MKMVFIKKCSKDYIIFIYIYIYTCNNFTSLYFFVFLKAQKGLKMTFFRGIQLTISFFFPKLSPYLNARMLGTSTNFFRKVFWNSMDNREITKNKREDLIDSLIELKNDKQDKDFSQYNKYLILMIQIFNIIYFIKNYNYYI